MQASPKNLNIYSELKPRKARSKNGCLQCRSKRKKCDESRPVCEACFRVRSECTWPTDALARGQAVHNPLVGGRPCQDRTELAHTPKLSRSEQNLELWTHFMEHTVPWMLFSKHHAWLIRDHVVPLAMSEELVHHAVLAVSGVHLRCAQPTKEKVALYHYDCALRDLKERLSDRSRTTGTAYRVLFTAMVLLCHCEFIDGNTHGGALQHVRACRAFIEPATHDLEVAGAQDLAVLLLEHYGYFAIMGCFYGEGGHELETLAIDFCDDVLPRIRRMSSFGSMFAYEPASIRVMPEMLRSLARLRQESETGPTSRDWEYFEHLYLTIETSRDAALVDSNSTTPPRNEQEQVVIRFKQAVLLVLIEASIGKCPFRPTHKRPSLLTRISTAEDLLRQLHISDTSYGLLCAMLLFGSFLKHASSQSLLLAYIDSFQSSMPLEHRGRELLMWLWVEDDSSAQGPEALKETAARHGVSAYIC